MAAILDYAAGEGFGELMQLVGIAEYASARAYRERHMREIVLALVRSGTLHRH